MKKQTIIAFLLPGEHVENLDKLTGEGTDAGVENTSETSAIGDGASDVNPIVDKIETPSDTAGATNIENKITETVTNEKHDILDDKILDGHVMLEEAKILEDAQASVDEENALRVDNTITQSE